MTTPDDWARWAAEGRSSTGPNPYPTGTDANRFWALGRSQLRQNTIAATEITEQRARQVAKAREMRTAAENTGE